MENNEYFVKLKKLSSTCTILLVEDDLKYQELILKFLNKLFKKVLLANDGEEGLSLYKKEKIDLVLTALNLPKLNGHDMIREIRKIHVDAEILVLSSHTDSSTLLSCIHLGISDFISKPADDDKMIIIFLRVLLNMKKKDDIFSQIRLKNEKNEEILSFLHENSMPIDIINYYKGLVFRSSAYIKEVDEESIRLKINSLQLLACKNEKFAVLDSSLIGENICCSLLEVYDDNYEILLKKEKFFYPKLKMDNEVTLESCQKINGFFMLNENKVLCKINKISKKEIFITFEDNHFDIKKHDEIDFYLFIKNKISSYERVESIVYKIIKKDNINKIILLIKKDKNIEEYIQKYIFTREEELLEEFKRKFLL